MGVMLKSQSPYTREQPCRSDFWVVRVRNFTEELWIQNLRRSRSGLDELCDATGPLVVPVKSWAREPVSTDKRTLWDVNVNQEFPLHACVICLYWIAPNSTSCNPKKRLLQQTGVFRNWHLPIRRVSFFAISSCTVSRLTGTHLLNNFSYLADIHRSMTCSLCVKDPQCRKSLAISSVRDLHYFFHLLYAFSPCLLYCLKALWSRQTLTLYSSSSTSFIEIQFCK